MPATNLVAATLTAEQKAAILSKITEIEKALPFIRGLSPEERVSLPKMGDKSVAFVQQSLEAAERHPTAIPAQLNVGEFRNDLELWRTLQPIAMELARLDELLNDTLLALGSDLFTSALSTYGYLKASGHSDGLDDLKAQLSRRFTRHTKPATEPAAKA